MLGMVLATVTEQAPKMLQVVDYFAAAKFALASQTILKNKGYFGDCFVIALHQDFQVDFKPYGVELGALYAFTLHEHVAAGHVQHGADGAAHHNGHPGGKTAIPGPVAHAATFYVATAHGDIGATVGYGVDHVWQNVRIVGKIAVYNP